MPRIARVVIPGVPHHLTQRGNCREDVFFSDDDRQRYLMLLLEYADKYGLETLAYCLMRNHVHLVCVPAHTDSLALVMKPVNLRYAQHINWILDTRGRLWQGRFFSCPLDEDHFRAALRYVERNPVRARIVRRAEDYPWSSAAAHCGLRRDPLLSPLPAGIGIGPSDWSAWLADRDDDRMLETLRRYTRTGRPAGGRQFVALMEARLNRRLWARPVGRPKIGKGNSTRK